MRKVVLVTVPVLALIAGCGGSSHSGATDYSPYYIGTYAGTETVSITSFTTGQTSTASYQIAFQIGAGAGISDLVFGGSCGLTGHASSPNNFITFQTTCTTPASGCNYTYNLQAGAGSKNGTALAMSIPGTATIVCPTASDTGSLTITWSMTQQ